MNRILFTLCTMIGLAYVAKARVVFSASQVVSTMITLKYTLAIISTAQAAEITLNASTPDKNKYGNLLTLK